MGVTRQCSSSELFRSQERLSFRGDSQGVTVSDLIEKQIDSHARFDYDVVPNAITILSPQLSGILYWRLPQNFLGNKLTSYGGKLHFAVQFSGQDSPVDEPLVVLKGNEITLVHKSRLNLSPDHLNPIEVDIYETSFTREDGQHATHEHLLMTLANLEALLIRQTHSHSQSSSSLGEITLDTAVPDYTGQEKAHAVEKCSCPEGYVGSSCELCAPGYERSGGGLYLGTCDRSGAGGGGDGGDSGNGGYETEYVHTTQYVPVHRPTRPYRPSPVYDQCNVDGSLTDRPDPRTGQCQCKEQVTGQRCDQCKPYSYHLKKDNPAGCISCFCSGVTKECHSSQLFRQESSTSDFRSWTVPVRTGEVSSYTVLPSPAVPTEDGRGLHFESFQEFSNGRALYFQLPEALTGNKITAYGGKMRLRFSYTSDGSTDDQKPCVVIRGNDISLFHTTSQPTAPDRENVIEIPIFENEWQREDKHPSPREHFLMTLADLETLLIKISWKDGMRSFTLHEVSFDYASHVPSHLGPASAVEECRCPAGYVGSSCEDCASGYSRTGGGLYLGLCEPCFCHGHSTECDTDYGECKNCQHNTVGGRCEQCAPGYRGDARRGTPYDCQPDGGGAPFGAGWPAVTDEPDRREPGDREEHGHGGHGEHGAGEEGGEHGETGPEGPEPTAAYQGVGEEHSTQNGGEHFTQNGEEHVTPNGEHPAPENGEEHPAHGAVEHGGEEHASHERGEHGSEGEAGVEMTPNPEQEITWPTGGETPPDVVETTMAAGEEHVTNGGGGGGGEEPHEETTAAEEEGDDHGPDRGDQPDRAHTLKYEDETTTQSNKAAKEERGPDEEGIFTTSATEPQCEACNCNGHSQVCTSDCKCVDCIDDTEGDHCEHCKRGFFGEATAGTPWDCKECPCKEADSCFMDTDGLMTCKGCPEGFAGRLCDDCAPGYEKDKDDPKLCKLVETGENARLLKIRRLKKRKLLRRRLRNF